MRHFLEQCLYSLRSAMGNVSAEVWVVDNASSDGSVARLKPLFPEVNWIELEENLGFGRANNLALDKAGGRFILFLNPDTLLPEDCLEKCLAFMAATPDAGALGIRMVDGSGRFLPESKRAFPDPLTSLYKLSGLSALFPRSRIFSRYYLGHLPEGETHPVEVLAGAFMLVRNEVLAQTGGFDERFFMYGEDIDLSFRIFNTPNGNGAGHWKNYYFAGSSIIHFKGESTKKGSLNYVLLFYKAMVQFVKKHYGAGRVRVFMILLYLAIGLRAVVSFVVQLLQKVGLPLMDLVLVTGSLFAVWRIWASWVRPDVIWMPEVVQYALPAFAGVFLLSGTLAGLYSTWYSARRAWSALFLAILAVLAVYSLLPESWRFSRGIVLFGGLISGILMMYLRSILARRGWLRLDDETAEQRQTLVVGTPEDYEEIGKLLSRHFRQGRLLGRLSPDQQPANALMTVDAWKTRYQLLPARELIFCTGAQLSMARVIQLLDPGTPVRYKFHYAGSTSIVGSSDSHQAGETLAMQLNFNLAKPAELNRKRLVDIFVSFVLLLTWPLQILLVKNPGGLWRIAWQVIRGNATWVGYIGQPVSLPPLRKGVLCCNGLPPHANSMLRAETRQALNSRYALDYHYWMDLSLIKKGYRFLGSLAD